MGVELFSVILLVLTHFSWGQNTIIAPSQPIMASVGTEVTLPCRLDPVKDLRDTVVEWARSDLTPRYIHIRRNGLDYLLDQNSLYLGRTALSESRLQKGDMSLSLTKVRVSDGGTYRCYIPQMDTKAEVTLLVVSVAPPSVSLTKERSGSPVLRCESRGWYPEPELEWLDSEGTVLLRTEAQRGASDELFTVSSRLSVEQRHGNTFTCRVRQQESGQSREAQLILTDEFLEACASCSVAWVLFGLGLCLAAAAAAFVVWKFKINKTKTGTRENKHEDCEEAVAMLRPKEKHHSEDQKLSEYQEDLEQITAELQSAEGLSKDLAGTKDFLTKLKEKLQKHNNGLNTDIKKKKKKKKKKTFTGSDKEKLEKMEAQKKEFEVIIKDADTELGRIDQILSKTSEKKGKLEADKKKTEKLVQKEERRLETAVPPETKQEVENKVNVQNETREQMKETEAEEEKREEKKLMNESHDRISEMNEIQIPPEIPVSPQEPTEVQSQQMESEKTGSTATGEQGSAVKGGIRTKGLLKFKK